MYNYNHKITFFFKSCRYKQMFNVHSNTNRLHSSSKDWDSRNTCTCIQTFIFLTHKFTSMTGFTVGPTEYRIRVYSIPMLSVATSSTSTMTVFPSRRHSYRCSICVKTGTLWVEFAWGNQDWFTCGMIMSNSSGLILLTSLVFSSYSVYPGLEL